MAWCPAHLPQEARQNLSLEKQWTRIMVLADRIDRADDRERKTPPFRLSDRRRNGRDWALA
jgi:hypothetical protein